MESEIQFIREVCIKANPNIVELVAIGAPVRANAENIYRAREIRLADVLLAIIQDKYKDIVPDIRIIWEIVGKWRLAHDDLTLQAEETIKFLVDLLKSE